MADGGGREVYTGNRADIRSRPRRPGADGPLRVGVVGAGFIGETHVAAWAAEGIRAVIHDVDADRAAALAERHGARVAGSLDELFGAVDVVDVCTPTHLHVDVALAAARGVGPWLAKQGWMRPWEIQPPPLGYLTVLPALILVGLMLGSLGMLLSSLIKQLENFSGVMNFVIFPMFFASSALYPLWRVKEGSPALYYVCQANPFTHAVELIRFALYGQINGLALAVVAGCTSFFMLAAIVAYDPSRGLMSLRGAPGAAG